MSSNEAKSLGIPHKAFNGRVTFWMRPSNPLTVIEARNIRMELRALNDPYLMAYDKEKAANAFPDDPPLDMDGILTNFSDAMATTNEITFQFGEQEPPQISNSLFPLRQCWTRKTLQERWHAYLSITLGVRQVWSDAMMYARTAYLEPAIAPPSLLTEVQQEELDNLESPLGLDAGS